MHTVSLLKGGFCQAVDETACCNNIEMVGRSDNRLQEGQKRQKEGWRSPPPSRMPRIWSPTCSRKGRLWQYAVPIPEGGTEFLTRGTWHENQFSLESGLEDNLKELLPKGGKAALSNGSA